MRDLLLLLPLVAALVITTSPVFATTGMGGGNDDDNPGGDTHRDLVGNPDEEGEEGSEDDEQDRDGPDGESAEGDDEGEANCWGKVTSDAASEPGDDDDGIGGRAFGEHAGNPTGDEDNDTPREGVGNQDEDHPSENADAVGEAFSDEECAEDYIVIFTVIRFLFGWLFL